MQQICEWLLESTNGLVVLLLDGDGKTIARAGQTDAVDVTRLSAIVAANARGLVELLAEESFSTIVEAGRLHVHYSKVRPNATLVVLFDERTSLGLVRLRIKKATQDLERAPSQGGDGGSGAPVTLRK